ncbi:MAG: SRPBCC domain-containing protein [Caldilineaceae bacterium]
MDEFGTLVDAHTVRFERLLPGPIERVWAYLTEPQFLRTWLADSTMDLRIGGAVELRFDTDEVPERAKAGAIDQGIALPATSHPMPWLTLGKRHRMARLPRMWLLS